ncbi:DUF2797 domain-containing protein [Alicyclobacillus cycloheptanicus]|uniref:DUF2797 domain-containing protein n=1 Tax=Alicyclobacillus cycloheptanicus TaxID=1457 RepID=A0ABT9XDU5_9BACL|nr:DUF2797 domain-containing protein [Alicyclobacillus cycloheptanicus]MDQ0188458.1 hypothetical protein [Alicyclobacillus cycloheptanicus]WDM01151.1 DUF2797 domain-containing protein [Alicyclobacillus cycloheptanicus]
MGRVLEGFMREMKHRADEPVQYEVVTDDGAVSLNDWLGRRVEITFTGEKACIHCGRKVKKLYQNGYCFPCVTTLAECDLCIVKPHKCHFHLGTCRDADFAASHCMIPHYVYLAFSSDIKVGLTRKGRQFTRWVDQGASAAVLVAECPTRKAAGEVEMEIASFLPDKTQWRKMLALTSIETEALERLEATRQQVLRHLREHVSGIQVLDEQPVHAFQYPRLEGGAVKLTSLSLDKTPEISGVLQGVKGQYLLLDVGVLNVKKHSGMRVSISVA